MATFRITTSVVTAGPSQHAFADDTAAADSLIVDASANLIATGADSAGAFLAPTLGWRVTVNGWVHSQALHGLHLAGGNTALSTLQIGRNGEVGGGDSGILAESSATINNAGVIAGSDSDSYGVRFQGVGIQGTIRNSGTISSPDVAIFVETQVSGMTITNIGTITGLVASGADSTVLNNSGVINGTVLLVSATSKVVNSKQINGNVSLRGDGPNTVSNKGTIAGHVFGEFGNEIVTNYGTITGDVALGGGNDVLTNKGTILGVVNLRSGDDIFNGGNRVETVGDGDGADQYRLAGGNDTYVAIGQLGADGNDVVDGGQGVDTYDASIAITRVFVNLDKVSHDLTAVGTPGGDSVAASTATGTNVSGSASDAITNFENVRGGNTHDTIYGSAAANLIEGNSGDDNLFGFAGNDRLLGGDGFDLLVGGLGADILDGGAADGLADRYVYLSTKDSSVAKNGRDTIANFEDSLDLIDLGAIDARAGTATDDPFVYINGDGSVNPAAAFTGTAGELRSVWTATGYAIEGDVNGDGKADFAIDIVDPTHAIVLTSADFVL